MGINSYTVVNWIGAAVAKQYVIEGPFALTTGTRVQLGSTSRRATEVQVYGYQSIGSNTIPLANGAAALLSGSAGSMVDSVPAGGMLLIKPQLGSSIDVSSIYALGTTGDSVYIKYLQ